MGARVFRLLPWILLQPYAVVAQPSVAKFKELLSAPSAIEQISAERRYSASSKPTDYYFGRWQSNGFVLSVSTNAQNVDRGGPVGSLTQAFGRYDDLLWQVYGANRPLKIGTVRSLGSKSELPVSSYWASVDLGRLLNFGIDHLRPGEVNWIGNTYLNTNHSHNVVVSGEVGTNVSGQVTHATMNISILSESPFSPGEVVRRHRWELEYQYNRSISDTYPAVIKRYVLRQQDRFLRDEIHIHSLKLATGVMQPALFAYDPYVLPDSWILRGTNNTFYYTAADGTARPVPTASSP